ncbi:MAG: hypothetical protein ACTSW1_09105 [Candidatus Hodarchaeales archaeon]
MELKEEKILQTLLESLIDEVNKKKIIKQGYEQESLLYDLFYLSNNRKSKLFQSSSVMFLPDSAEKLAKAGYIQELDINGTTKYALSFLGVSEALQLFHKYDKKNQFSDFLKQNDEKYQKITVTGELNWREELAIITLLFLGCVTENSALKLNNELNRDNFETLMKTNISILAKYGVFDKNHELPKSRGEPRSTLFMRSRINDLARKTNHIYKNIGSGEGYYLDIVDNNQIDVEKVNYLLKKIFRRYNPEIGYNELKNDLMENARSYQSKFISINFKSGTLIDLLDAINNFFNREIWELI